MRASLHHGDSQQLDGSTKIKELKINILIIQIKQT